MKNVIKLMLFVGYIVLLFCVKNEKVFVIWIIINFFASKIAKVNFLSFLENWKTIFGLIIFTVFVNILLNNFKVGIILGMRMLLAYQITYIFSRTFSISELVDIIEMLLLPLKILKINGKHISLMLAIALCMVPILQSELEQTKNSLKSKGYKFKINNLNILMKPMIISVIKKTNDLEKALLVKGFQE